MLAARPIEIAGPLEDGVLLFRKMTVREELGRPFEFELDLVSEDGRLRFEDVLGQRLTVRLALPGGKRRYFDGFVSRFAQEGRSGRYATYQATVRPWLWFLTRTADCRIFQGKTVPEIVKEVFREHGFTDFEEVLSGTYRTREYCVQYRETDFNFVSRLLEQEGIYYYFKHEEGKHSLVLADSYSAHDLIPGYEEIPYYPPSAVAAREDHIHGWSLTQEVQPGAYALNTFDFEKPRASLAVKATFPRQHTASDYEVYDYPGEYLETGDGDTYARVRVEELQAGHEQASGQGDPRGLAVGGLFALTGYPREDQNREYLVISAVHRLELDVYESGKQGAGPVYSCHFRAIESKQPYHAARLTSKPVVQGPQTAIVVGKAGEEIWTDQYGRVKVQFHWDRLGKRDENSSCWVRVAQVWAGKSWGGIHIPRLGQEVIVEFLEGDPDRPIITGRVYNADQMPPYELPANATRSGLLSRSTKGGGPANFNEIRFEDKKGEEELYIHAEKDRTVVVEADERHDVGGNRTRGVGGDEAVTVGGARTKRVGASETVTIAADHSESVGGSETRTVAASQTETVGAGVTRTVGASLTDTIGASATLSVGGGYTTTVAAEHSTKLGAFSEIVGGAKSSITAGAVLDVTAGMKKEVMAGVKIESTGGVKIENFAGMRISLAAGGFIEKGPFKKINNDSHEIESGTVIIKAGSITLKGPVTIKGDLTVKGNFSNPSVDSKK